LFSKSHYHCKFLDRLGVLSGCATSSSCLLGSPFLGSHGDRILLYRQKNPYYPLKVIKAYSATECGELQVQLEVERRRRVRGEVAEEERVHVDADADARDVLAAEEGLDVLGEAALRRGGAAVPGRLMLRLH
jgi:hypothetical protein